jgi:hypothetical protein
MQITDNSLFRQQCYIAGEWLDADDSATIEVTNPATADIIGTIPTIRLWPWLNWPKERVCRKVCYRS